MKPETERTPQPLSEVEARALLALVKYGYMTCANLGNELWHKGGRGNCSCPFARPAGAVIKRLRDRGLVESYRVSGDPRTFYRVKWNGAQHLSTDELTRAALGNDANPGDEP